MENTPNGNLEAVKTANKEMLDYFNNEFLKHLEDIQAIKTQAFEIDIKIDELEKTKDIYAFKTNSKRSVFTPIINDDMGDMRSKIIDDQINGLNDVRESLQTKLRSLESTLAALKQRLATLNAAEDAIKSLEDIVSPYSETSAAQSADDGFEFIEAPPKDDFSLHGYNILMQDAFEKAYLAALIDKNIKDGITGVNNKLEMISYLLGTDISRARLTIREIIHNSRQILDSIDDIEEKMNSRTDSTKSILTLIDEFVMEQRDNHPECIIDAEIECTDYEISLHPVFSINTIKLLNIFFDNIFKHSNANKIEFKLCLTPNIVDIYIKDNGIGIPPDYLAKSPWYSSLHKAHEIVYLLCGKLDISGSEDSGTAVRFSFNVQK